MSSRTFPLLRQLGYLEKNHVRVKDPVKTEELLQRLISGGFPKLQIVADFDYTLTRVHDETGKRLHCSWGVLDNSPLMPEFYRPESKVLLDKYYPVEISPHLTEQEKIPQMVDWYKQVQELLARSRITSISVRQMVEESNTQLRIGTESLLASLEASEVPVLVFSAGMGDILMHILRKFQLYSPNVKIVSNFFKYDYEDCVVGFENETIHMFNKNENVIHSSPYFKNMSGRNNVILLGDSLGDIKMAHGVPDPGAILKIGFLNDKVEERLSSYEEAFDVVLIDDQTMDAPMAIVKLML
ncbi:cytosolic 5'-nucleotidase 3 isoform X2 [Hyalella azteca]|uniref:5'-nucleotidase n=1 Tax=Hyalella azteca TaxID=294128 RepID=A0A8B7NS33_HYAAZ|nr:cytosolic 5'-nucleotidase 3 isoform X2 [Hyalella azteca]